MAGKLGGKLDSHLVLCFSRVGRSLCQTWEVPLELNNSVPS
jgi:hypothetical protein